MGSELRSKVTTARLSFRRLQTFVEPVTEKKWFVMKATINDSSH
jgi:hypothetical protein